MFKKYDPKIHCFVELIKPTGLKFLIDRHNEERVRRYNWYLNRYRKSIRIRRTSDNLALGHYLLDGPADHISGNQFDNRESNLRLATNKQNGRRKP